MRNKLAAISLIAWSGYAFAETYVVTDLGTFVPGGQVMASALNNAGQVTGYITNVGYPPALQVFLYSNNQLQDLGTGDGSSGYALGINAHGSIVGGYSYPDGTSAAALWNGTSVTTLSSLGGDAAQARAINSAGQIVGLAATTGESPQPEHAVIWNGITPIDLGTLGGINSYAFAINDAGDIVGESYTTGNNTPGALPQHAFLYHHDTMTDLGTLGGMLSVAFGINNSGQIVGYATTAGETAQYAVLWRGSQITNLGTVPGAFGSIAYGINDDGIVVGYSRTNTGPDRNHATAWHTTTAMDLNTEIGTSIALYVTLTEAIAINNNGSIAANGFNSRTNEYKASVLSGR